MSETVDTSIKEVEEVNTKDEEEELLQDNEEVAITISEDHAEVLETTENGDAEEGTMEEKDNTTEDNGETKTEDDVKEEEEEDQGKDLGEEDEDVAVIEVDDDDDDEEEEEEDEDEPEDKTKFDPNVMPQVNVAVLAKRKWQVKVYPLKPADFASGMVSKVFKAARESLLYLMTGPQSRGKGEMYIQNVAESVNVVRGLMNLDSHFHEINIEVLRKNNEGAIQEKAYMRFDTKMVQMLFQGPSTYQRPNSRGQYNKFGKKRERLIGSVFVKNLPPGTSKNMLRVMFPFAQEINYNPEKYSEGTARLVLKSRNTVIPCLKAFAKVELGGNILELHPLEKKRHGPAQPRDSNRSSSQKGDDDKEDSKSETSSGKPGPASKTKRSFFKDKPKKSFEPKAKDDEKDDSKKSEAGDKKEGDTKTDKDKKHADRPGTGKTPFNRKERKERLQSFKDRNAHLERKGLGLRRGGGASGSRFVGQGAQRGGRGGFNSSRSSFGAGPRRGMGRGMPGQDRRVGAALGVTKELAAKVEATKDMMVLQNQLNMAIKGQLAMLNQTKRAVEQAKIGLATSSTVSRAQRETALERDYLEERRSRANDSDFSYGSKRNASQASLDYDDYDRKRSAGFSAQGGARAQDSLAGLGGSRAQAGQTGRGRGRGKRGQQQRQQQRAQGGSLASERAAATSRAIATQSRALASERSFAQNRSFEERSLAQTQRSQAQRSLAQQSRSLAQQQSRGMGQSRASGYDDDLYRQDAYRLQDPVDDGYGYGGATESRYSSTGRLDTVRGASTYDDNYGYSRY